MTDRPRFFSLSLLLLVLGGALVPCSQKTQAEEGRLTGFHQQTFAIQNASVIVRPGEVLENATVVIHQGVIQAVGKNLKPPAEAEIISGKGLFVYAAFVDAAGSQLLDTEQKPKPAAGRKWDVTRYVLAATRPDNRKGLTPEYQTAENLKLDSAKLEELRKSGFAAVHLLPDSGLASGQGSLVSTGGTTPRDSVMLSNTFNQFCLKSLGGSTYPATLMGSHAHLRQAFLDARHYATHWQLYRESKTAIRRPPSDPTLETLHQVLTGKRKAVFLVNSRDDIHRTLNFCEEQSIQPVLWGGSEIHECLDQLAKSKTDLILPLNFGEMPKIEPPKPSEKLITDVKDPVRVQEDKQNTWLKRIKGFQELHQRGLRFGVSSREIKTPAEMLKAMRTLIENGLPREVALAALTTNPAKILGLEARMGTVEKGKLGSIAVFTKPFDDEKTKLRFLFLDGRRFEYNTDAKPDDKSQKKTEPAPEKPAVAVRYPKTDPPTELDSDRLNRPFQTRGNAFIKNATIITGTGETLENASLLITNGKITAIGKNLKPARNAQVIDASGKFVMPGIIDTHSHIMITNGINEATQSLVPEVRVKDVVDTKDVSEYRALAGGVTSARLLHGSANVVGGQDAVVKLKHGKTAREHILHDAPQGVKFMLGENLTPAHLFQEVSSPLPIMIAVPVATDVIRSDSSSASSPSTDRRIVSSGYHPYSLSVPDIGNSQQPEIPTESKDPDNR